MGRDSRTPGVAAPRPFQTTARPVGRILAMARASHPVPSAGVTAYATTLAAAAGNGPARCVVLALAVLAGQLSIGWSNDRFDAPADREAARRDKPLATGALPDRALSVGIALVLPITIALSLALGWRAGLVHLAAVGCGWAYNRWLKGTWLSAVPYALAFAALPVVATLALPRHPLPAWWPVVAAALLGVAANLTNALPDLERDRRTGFRGMPSRIGARPSVALAGALLVASAAVLAVGPAGPAGPTDWCGLALVIVIVGVVAPIGWRGAHTRVPFYALMLVVPVLLAMIVAGGHPLR